MTIEHCNLCGGSLSQPGSGGTTVGVSLTDNRLTVSHTKCYDMHTKQAKPIHVVADMHSRDYDGDPIEDLNEWERVRRC